MSRTLALHADVMGQGPALLFLPGLGGDRRAFAGIQKNISTGRKTFALDPRDTGLSERSSIEYNLDDMAADLIAFMDQQGIGQADIVGHSMGGMIAQHLAIMAPERVRSMVLMSCHARNYAWKIALVQSWMALKTLVTPVEFTRQTMPWLLGPELFENQAHIAGMIRHVERNPSHPEPEAFARQGRAVQNHDVIGALHNLEMPVLVIAGALDRVTPPETSKVLADHIPNSHFELFENIGHLPHIEATTRLTTLLNRFLADPAELTAGTGKPRDQGE